ncbi:MAG: GNAT family N-acetyltransferase, partial [Candidatus Hodarchaeota archaeon]
DIQKKDRKICIEIINTCLREVNSNNYTSEFIKYLVESYSKHFMKRPGITTIIIEKDGVIIGTGSISNQGQIRDVFVDVQNHRKGYGKKLMVQLEDSAKRKNIKTLFLYSAISAINFYEKLGYTRVDQLNHGDGDIEIKMEKTLELN